MSSRIQDLAHPVVVIGGGFCGLAAAYDLTRAGVPVVVLDGDQEVGGLAGSFEVGGVRLEKFYHHWFTNDLAIMRLIEDLGLQSRVRSRATRTGVYFGNRFFKLSTPLDLMRFQPLSFGARIRLGLLALQARRVSDWRHLEALSASDWLRSLGGDEAYRVVWEPLLRGKFGSAADEVSAVWMWNKLKLRGGSRGKAGDERLVYFDGGFAALADAMAQAIEEGGGRISTGTAATRIEVDAGRVVGVRAMGRLIATSRVLATPALPIVADLLEGQVDPAYLARLRAIRYLANICVVLELDRSLSSTYWLNVNDPSFPFVAVIEHTNFECPEHYGGRHIVYLSRYLPANDPLYALDDAEFLDDALGHLRRMFPQLDRSWILDAHIWRADFAQPIITRHYSRLIPARETPVAGLHLATMAQIYPQDRGTNYAVRAGREAAQWLLES